MVAALGPLPVPYGPSLPTSGRSVTPVATARRSMSAQTPLDGSCCSRSTSARPSTANMREAGRARMLASNAGHGAVRIGRSCFNRCRKLICRHADRNKITPAGRSDRALRRNSERCATQDCRYGRVAVGCGLHQPDLLVRSKSEFHELSLQSRLACLGVHGGEAPWKAAGHARMACCLSRFPNDVATLTRRK
jgi:hypothetical protein